jgi:hypothetical protein
MGVDGGISGGVTVGGGAEDGGCAGDGTGSNGTEFSGATMQLVGGGMALSTSFLSTG